MISRGMESPEKSEAKAEERVSRKKQLQRLKPAEDERKLQMNKAVSTEKLGPFFIAEIGY